MKTFSILFIIAVATVSRARDNAPAVDFIWEPPSEIWKALPEPTVPKPMITSLSVSGFPITFEETPLVNLQKHFGGTIGTRGDAGEFLQWLCLVGADRSGPWALWLESGEIDAGTVAGFHWRRVRADAKVDGRCQKLGRNARVELSIPIKPGMTEKDVLAILGSATARKGNNRIFVHEHEESVKGETFFDTNTVELVVRGGHVTSIGVWKSTTN